MPAAPGPGSDGSGRNTETYNASGQLTASKDADGNTVSYTYNPTSGLLTTITDASGQVTTLTYSGNNLTSISVSSNSVVQTVVRYTYDDTTNNRLRTVTVDLTPGDNSVADNVTYTTTYTYDGTSKRIASITQKDGSTISFTYQQINGAYRVKTFTDGMGRLTTLNYSSYSYGRGGVSADRRRGCADPHHDLYAGQRRPTDQRAEPDGGRRAPGNPLRL